MTKWNIDSDNVAHFAKLFDALIDQQQWISTISCCPDKGLVECGEANIEMMGFKMTVLPLEVKNAILIAMKQSDKIPKHILNYSAPNKEQSGTCHVQRPAALVKSVDCNLGSDPRC